MRIPLAGQGLVGPRYRVVGVAWAFVGGFWSLTSLHCNGGMHFRMGLL